MGYDVTGEEEGGRRLSHVAHPPQRADLAVPTKLRPAADTRPPMPVKGLLAIVLVAAVAAAAMAPAAGADPRTKACGSVTKQDRTLRLRAGGMSCRKARKLIRTRSNNSGQVIGNEQYSYSAAGCEGILWRRHERDYSQSHDGRLPANGKFVRYVVTKGCVS